jgi:hypothetical protein
MQHTNAYWKMRRKLAKGLGNQIDEIQAEKKSSKTEVNAEVIKHFQALRQKTDEVLAKLKDLQDASENTRENLKEELEKELDDLKAAVDDAISRFR